jgi:hypothetical protein
VHSKDKLANKALEQSKNENEIIMKNLKITVAVMALSLVGVMNTAAQETAKKKPATEMQKEKEVTSKVKADDVKEKKSPLRKVDATINGVAIEVEYSAPSARGREVMGGLVPYGEIWRTGANNATTIMFSKKVFVEGEEVPAGTYSLFTIPNEGEWTIILNRVDKQWGAYKYDEKEDQLRVEVKTKKSDAKMEMMKFSFNSDNQLVLHWDDVMVPIQIK